MNLARIAAVISVSANLMLPAAITSAQNFPTKVIRIVASEAGSAGDNVARAVAQSLPATIGQPVIIDNRPGGVVAGDLVAKAPADGYTVLSYGSNLWLLPLLRDNVPYDPVRDFAPVTATVRTLSVLVVHPSLPVRSVKELIALAKSRPGVLNYASGVAGSSGHLSAELFKHLAQVNIVRIPFKGVASGVSAVMTGEVQMMFVSISTAKPHLQSGRVKALAIASDRPSELMPGVPSISSAGLTDFESGSTYGMFVPAGTPVSIINYLNQEIVRVLNRQDIKQRFSAAGSEVVASAPAQFAARIRSDMLNLGKLIKEAGIRDQVF